MPEPTTAPMSHNELVDWLSEKARTGSVPVAGWRSLRARLTDAQVERIGEKVRYENVSWVAVLADWPGLFKREEA